MSSHQPGIQPLNDTSNRNPERAAWGAIGAASLAGVAAAPNFTLFMAARALLGVTIGGFWSLSTATVMRLVPEKSIRRAMGVLYLGNAVATAFAAPIGSYLGGLIGWRGVFWALVPLAAATLAWQWIGLPSMPAQTSIPLRRVFGLLRRRNVGWQPA